MNWIKVLAIQLLIAFISLEFFSFIITKLELFFVNDTPSVYRSDNLSLYDVHDGRTEYHPWGTWRVESQKTYQLSSCFNVEIKSNEIGARDTSFIHKGKNAIFLLGDSFAEGVGVPYDKTSQYILESLFGQELLNFGAAANIGPLQELIIYKNFHDKYTHGGILIYILPSNDFTDNDARVWKKKGVSQRRRYRPYFSETEDPLDPWYFPEAIPQKRYNDLTSNTEENGDNFLAARLKRLLVNYTWTSNALRSASYLLTERQTVNSFYYDALGYQQENFVKSYAALVRLAKDKPVVFVIIPSKQDILYYLRSNKSFSYRNQTWFQGLQNLKQEHKVEVIDLIESIPVDYHNLFHRCDAHWNIEGNKWAAQIIFNTLREKGFNLKAYKLDGH